MGRNLGAHKDIEAMARVARKEGWRVEIAAGNHLRFYPPNPDLIPDGENRDYVQGSLTPSRERSVLILRKRLIKAGLKALDKHSK